MSKMTYWISAGVLSGIVGIGFLASMPALSGLLDVDTNHVLAYSFLLIGMSVAYFGLMRPHWFIKEIIPTASPVKVRVSKAKPKPLNLKDDSYFWNLFPYALFFCVGGLAYLWHPSPLSLIVALICSVWVRVLYKFV